MSEGDDARKALERLQKTVDEYNNKVFNNADDLQDNILTRINQCQEIVDILNKARDAQKRQGN
jgi:hypothetical protein